MDNYNYSVTDVEGTIAKISFKIKFIKALKIQEIAISNKILTHFICNLLIFVIVKFKCF